MGVAKYEYLPKNGVWEKSKKHLSCKMMNCLEEIHLPCCWSTPFQLQNRRFSKTWRHVIKAKALFKLGLSSFVNGSSMIYNIPGPGQTFFLIWKTIFGEAMVCWNDQLHGIGIGASNAQFFGSHQSVFGCKRYQSSFTSIFRPTNVPRCLKITKKYHSTLRAKRATFTF